MRATCVCVPVIKSDVTGRIDKAFAGVRQSAYTNVLQCDAQALLQRRALLS